MTDLLPDGVFLGLDAQTYFSQKRMGSSDWKVLALQDYGWWWSSSHNPYYKAPDKKAFLLGHAGHAILLEGMSVYEERFIISPAKEDFNNLLFTKSDMHEALVNAGYEATIKKSWLVADYVRACDELLTDHVPWESVVRRFDETRGEKAPLSSEEDYELRTLYDAAMSDDDIQEVLGHNNDWPILAEVSFFWTDENGIRCRARFDKLTPKDILDVKTLANYQKRDLKLHTGSTILYDGLSLQVADQHDARKRMYAQIRNEGEACISGGTEEQRLWLTALALAGKPWNWVWLFSQRGSRTAGLAPVIYPVRDYWAGPAHRQGLRERQRAKEIYLDGIKTFGLENPWYRISPVHTTRQSGDNNILLPDDNRWNLLPIEGEEEALRR